MTVARRLLVLAAALATGSFAAAQARLDTSQIRNDFFAAVMGDPAAVKRVVDASEKVLAENPDHAQALVWHGGILLTGAGQDPNTTTRAAAMERFQKGVTEMDRAVELAPDDVEVRVIRGVLMAPISRQMPAPFSQRMLEKARSDYQRVFDIQQEDLDRLGTHPLGELLQGLGDVYSRQGKADDAQKYYGMIETKLKNTEYAKRAAQWMETRQPLPASQTACVGCHVPTGPLRTLPTPGR